MRASKEAASFESLRTQPTARCSNVTRVDRPTPVLASKPESEYLIDVLS